MTLRFFATPMCAVPTCPHLFEYADPIERDFGAASGPEVIR